MGISTISLAKKVSIIPRKNSISTFPPFVCDEAFNFHCHLMQTSKKVSLHGLGFFGPIEADEFYDVVVEITDYVNYKNIYTTGPMEKRIFAQKGRLFHFFFDTPIVAYAKFEDTSSRNDWRDCYDISFAIKGPNTSSTERKLWSTSKLWENGTQFRFNWGNKQLAEILFKKL